MYVQVVHSLTVTDVSKRSTVFKRAVVDKLCPNECKGSNEECLDSIGGDMYVSTQIAHYTNNNHISWYETPSFTQKRATLRCTPT